MDRRDFLRRLGLGSAALTAGGFLGPQLLSSTAQAAGEKDRYFLFVYFEGGWDVLLSLDPRDPRAFNEANMFETGIQPGYDRLPAQFSRNPIDVGPYTLGPCIGGLAEHADQLAVIRGVNMGTLTHEVGMRYFITGRVPTGLTARGTAVPTLAASQIGDQTTVPHLAHLVESYNLEQPPYAAALPVAAVGHLQYILQDSLGLPTGVPAHVQGALGAYWSKRPQCAPSAGAGSSALADVFRANRERAREVVYSNLYRQFQFESPELAEVRQRYGIAGQQIETPAGRAALAAQAMKTGLSRVVSVALATGLDTHDNTWANDHSTRLNEGFEALSRLIGDLRNSESPGGGSFWSKTTMVVFSEFCRTPRLNARNGRDHHLTNCALLGGGGLKGGMVVGGSSDQGLGPLKINLATGRPDESGPNLTPEHVLTTALESAGLDARDLRSEPIGALLA